MLRNNLGKILVASVACLFCFPVVSYADDSPLDWTIESDFETDSSITPEPTLIPGGSGDTPTDSQDNLQLLEETPVPNDVIGSDPDEDLEKSIKDLQDAVEKLQDSTNDNTKVLKSVNETFNVYLKGLENDNMKSGESEVSETSSPAPATIDDLHKDNFKIMMSIFIIGGVLLGFLAFKAMFDRRV